MVSISDIKLGSKRRRSFIDRTHDVNTTSDFGFCQPCLIDEVVADTNVSLKTNSFVRLAPLPQPTFGRIKMHQYASFVPMSEVFEAYDYLQSQQQVRSSVADYIPQSADFLSNKNIFESLINLSRYSAANYFSVGGNSFKDLSSILMTVTISFCGTSHVDHNPVTNKNLFQEIVELDTNSTSVSDSLNMLFNGDPAGNYENAMYHAMKIMLHETHKDSVFSDFDPGADFSHLALNSTYHNLSDPSWNELLLYPAHYRNALFSSFNAESADFVVHLSHSDLNLYPMAAKINGQVYALSGNVQDIHGNTVNWMDSCDICFRLTPFGRRIFKIFQVAGLNFRYLHNISVAPFFAYYKAWFDLMNPGREKQWRDTSAYKLIHSYYDTGVTLETSASRGQFAHTHNWYDFLRDLVYCNYCLPIDHFTVALDYPTSQQPSNDVELVRRVGQTFFGSDDPTVVQAGYFAGDNPYGYAPDTWHGNPTASINSLTIKMLERVLPFVNKNSVIGARVDKYCRDHFGYSPFKESNFLGHSSYMFNISDVTSTNESDDVRLGEYAGKGIGSGNSDKFTLHTNEPGFIISFFAIVPHGGYVQGNNPMLGRINRFDFYQSELDGLGMMAYGRGHVAGRSSVFDTSTGIATDQVFGYVPWYFDYKYKNNVHAGDFANLSTRDQLLGYSLDRYFSETHLDYETSISGVTASHAIAGTYPVPDESMRFVGLDEQYGNYDRIFYDTTGLTDNFIVQMVNEYSWYSPMLPISESFDTYDREVDDTAINVSHS